MHQIFIVELAAPHANRKEIRNKSDAEKNRTLKISFRNILNLLIARMEVARKIGMYKKKNDIAIYQAKRWELITKTAKEKGSSSCQKEPQKAQREYTANPTADAG